MTLRCRDTSSEERRYTLEEMVPHAVEYAQLLLSAMLHEAQRAHLDLFSEINAELATARHLVAVAATVGGAGAADADTAVEDIAPRRHALDRAARVRAVSPAACHTSKSRCRS